MSISAASSIAKLDLEDEDPELIPPNHIKPLQGSLNSLASIISLVETQINSTPKSSISTTANEPKLELKPTDLKPNQPIATTANVKIPTEKLKVDNKQKGQTKEQEDEFTLFSKAHLQVARLVTVDKHPQADKLYVCQVDIGAPDNRRQLVSGIVDYYTPAQLLNRLVITITNLAKAKLRGVESNVMLLAGDDSKTSKENRVILLDPPVGSEVGDRVYLEGGTISEASGNLKKEWEIIVSKLAVIDNKATYTGKAMITHKGHITIHLPDGSSIH